VLALALGWAALPTDAVALDLAPRDFRLRAGFGLNPDQLHAGVEAALGAPSRIRARPSLDLGLGNGVVMLSLNGDVFYDFAPARTRFAPYVGLGPALTLVDVTDGVGEAEGITAHLAGHVASGLEWRPAAGRPGRRYRVEARAGFGDTHDFKLTLAIGF
jgi:hypothetical protein